MKCEENGGCPLVVDLGGLSYAAGTGEALLQYCSRNGAELEEAQRDCHLTSAAFPRLRAELAGEWSCLNCQSIGTCDVIKLANELDVLSSPCAGWQPKEGEGR